MSAELIVTNSTDFFTQKVFLKCKHDNERSKKVITHAIKDRSMTCNSRGLKSF